MKSYPKYLTLSPKFLGLSPVDLLILGLLLQGLLLFKTSSSWVIPMTVTLFLIVKVIGHFLDIPGFLMAIRFRLLRIKK